MSKLSEAYKRGVYNFRSKESIVSPETQDSRSVVIKLGGDNMSTADNIRKSANIVGMDRRRRLVVVSAAGKRFDGDKKVTWILEDCGRVPSSEEFDTKFDEVRDRHTEIARDLFKGDADSLDEVNTWIEDAKKGILEQKTKITTKDGERDLLEKRAFEFSASRGEWLMGKLFAKFLQTRLPHVSFMDATEFMRVKDGQVAEETYNLVYLKLSHVPGIIVMPGFYGLGKDGEIETLGHGASDTTAAALAKGVSAQKLEIFKELLGVYSTNPKKYPKAGARLIPAMTYREMAEVAFREETPLHREAVRITSQAKIPINVRSFAAPEKPGTLIVDERNIHEGSKPIVVTGKNGYAAVTVKQVSLDTERLLHILANHGVTPDHSPATPTSLTVVFDRGKVASTYEETMAGIATDINSILQPGDQMHVDDNVQIVSAIGDGMSSHNSSANYRILRTLEKAGVDYITQTSRQGGNSLTLVVPEGQITDPVEVIHRKCVYRGGSISRLSRYFPRAS